MNQEMSNVQNKENIHRHKEASSLFKSERKEEDQFQKKALLYT